MLGAFTILDSVAEAFVRPFFAQSSGAAIRSFSDEVNGPKGNPVADHPADYTLFECGSFDELTGCFDVHAPKSLGNGLTFLVRSEVPDAKA